MNWEEIINGIETDEKVLECFSEFISEVDQLFPKGEKANEILLRQESILNDLYTMNERKKYVDFSNDPTFESQMYAGMMFIRFYLQKSWEAHWSPIPIEYLQLLAYMFIIGRKIG